MPIGGTEELSRRQGHPLDRITPNKIKKLIIVRIVTTVHLLRATLLEESREVPDSTERTQETRPTEDHMEFCFAFREQCAWYMEEEFVKLSVKRGIHTILGPRTMSAFDRLQMAMDSVSWCLYWEKRHEFNSFLTWQADLIRYLVGWLTQEEENEFQTLCNAFYVDMNSKNKHKSQNVRTSKALSGRLRHSNKRHLFSTSGTMNLGTAFSELESDSSLRTRMSPRDFAALLLSNDKQRFKIEIIVHWEWKPFPYPPTQPWEMRIGAFQGRSNEVVNPYEVHDALTFEETMCLGWIFHVTHASNRQSIERYGLVRMQEVTEDEILYILCT